MRENPERQKFWVYPIFPKSLVPRPEISLDFLSSTFEEITNFTKAARKDNT